MYGRTPFGPGDPVTPQRPPVVHARCSHCTDLHSSSPCIACHARTARHRPLHEQVSLPPPRNVGVVGIGVVAAITCSSAESDDRQARSHQVTIMPEECERGKCEAETRGRDEMQGPSNPVHEHPPRPGDPSRKKAPHIAQRTIFAWRVACTDAFARLVRPRLVLVSSWGSGSRTMRLVSVWQAPGFRRFFMRFFSSFSLSGFFLQLLPPESLHSCLSRVPMYRSAAIPYYISRPCPHGPCVDHHA